MTSTTKNFTTAAVIVVLMVTVLGTALAFQGWKSRIPGFDSLMDIDGAHELIQHQRLPAVSSLNSFAVYNPPGGSWLTLPGVLVFDDPRLFGAGSIILYVGTLVGILLLARIFFGIRCAMLAVAIYGVSELGLYVADSLWSRFPIHFFYVWMVYWIVQWVRKKETRYMVAGLVTLAMGMNVFLEIAPCLFVFPVVWWFYRPPLRFRSILLAGILSVAVWYPYLRLEYDRNFSDLRSTLGRRSDLAVNYKEAWCNPALTLVNLEGAAGTAVPAVVEPDPAVEVPTGISGKILRRVLPLWERSHVAVGGLFSNFELAARIPGIHFVLGLLLLTSLAILLVSGTSAQAAQAFAFRASHWLPKLAIGAIAAGVLWNEFLVARFLSPHGFLQVSTVSTIRWLQISLVLGGITMWVFRRRIVRCTDWLLRKMAVPSDAEVETAQHPVTARLLVLSLIVPWLLLYAFVESEARLDRLWWLWPLQAVVLAALITYVPARLGMPRIVSWIGSLLLVLTLGANTFLLTRVDAWRETGWSGVDPAEVQVVDYIAGQLDGKRPTAIGYQIYIWRFMAVFNSSDSRYKVGADFDLLFRDRRGISNTNQCAEGISPADEFRIVQVKPVWTDLRGKGYFEVPPDPGFRLLKQFGLYQVFRRDHGRGL